MEIFNKNTNLENINKILKNKYINTNFKKIESLILYEKINKKIEKIDPIDKIICKKNKIWN